MLPAALAVDGDPDTAVLVEPQDPVVAEPDQRKETAVVPQRILDVRRDLRDRADRDPPPVEHRRHGHAELVVTDTNDDVQACQPHREHDAEEVPDPYYGGRSGFRTVADLIEDGCDGLLEEVRRRIKE